jgi:hypothetical protein
MHQEFDPRDLEPALPQSEARRRRIKLGPLLLVLAGIGIFGAITWYAYEAGQRQAAVASMPVIKGDGSPTRVRPDSPGGLNVPNQDALVLNDPGGTPNPGGGAVEKLLPPPEAPLPRPAPAAGSVPPPIIAPPARPAASEPPAPVPAPRSSVESQPAAPAPAPAVAALSPPAATAGGSQTAALPWAAKPPGSVANPAAGGAGWRVQLAAVKSEQAAAAEWARIEKANPELAQLTMIPARVDLGDRGIFYRVQAGPLADAAAAERLCAGLKERKQGCIVVKP